MATTGGDHQSAVGVVHQSLPGYGLGWGYGVIGRLHHEVQVSYKPSTRDLQAYYTELIAYYLPDILIIDSLWARHTECVGDHI